MQESVLHGLTIGKSRVLSTLPSREDMIGKNHNIIKNRNKINEVVAGYIWMHWEKLSKIYQTVKNNHTEIFSYFCTCLIKRANY